jgi:hypothetical protein
LFDQILNELGIQMYVVLLDDQFSGGHGVLRY